ncbi:hypothetical protein niasHT_028174 [Heterodera trifolii]|uniref:Uncharacterized protein n=1 Tax=Heterodera trifolii TaxID=157864 RepID=A0ABD2JNU5_9BILA
MGPKKALPARRKAEPSEGEEEVKRKKAKRIVIEDEPEEETNGTGSQLQQNGHEEAMAPTLKEGDEEDEVGIYLLPLAPSDAGGITKMANSAGAGVASSVSINRLQFPQQQPNVLRRRFNGALPGRGNAQDGEEEEEDEEEQRTDRMGRKFFAQYKAQVKHLRLGFGSDFEEEAMASAVMPTFAGGGGIAELPTKNHTPSSSTLFSPPPSASASSSAVKGGSDLTSDEMFTGEGFSQQGLLNYAVGFFKKGRLFLLPVDKTFEMRKPLRGTIERESTARNTALKPSSSVSSTSTRSVAADSAPSGTASASSSSAAVAAPLRIRFARAENDLQRRRREQSSFYKQKLVEQDQWIPLKVEHRDLLEMYEKDINKVLLSSESPPK